MSPDISMCSGKGCPLKDTCYRHTAKPGPYWQSFIGAYYKDGKCDRYWPTEPDVKRKTPPTECVDKPQKSGPTNKERQV